MIDYINKYGLAPGTYQHHSGLIYVLMSIISHRKDSNGDLEVLKEPICVYRDLLPKEYEGYPVIYSCDLSYFKEKAKDKKGKEVKRFKHI